MAMGDCHFVWSSEPHKGQAICNTFMLSIDLVLEIKCLDHEAESDLSSCQACIDWAIRAAVSSFFLCFQTTSFLSTLLLTEYS